MCKPIWERSLTRLILAKELDFAVYVILRPDT